jgi:NAD(P)-dependent dehydrogenase (short-subunit alcohol dehydrogenase family)
VPRTGSFTDLGTEQFREERKVMEKPESKAAFITGAALGQGRSHVTRLVETVETLDRRIIATRSDDRDFGAPKKAVDDGVTQLGIPDIVIAKADLHQFVRKHRGLSVPGPYSAAKHGVVGNAKTMANELARHEIRVNTVHPMIEKYDSHEPFARHGKSPALAEPLADIKAKLKSCLDVQVLVPHPAETLSKGKF